MTYGSELCYLPTVLIADFTLNIGQTIKTWLNKILKCRKLNQYITWKIGQVTGNKETTTFPNPINVVKHKNLVMASIMSEIHVYC